MKAKVKVWAYRYLPSEVFAVIGALAGGLLANLLFRNAVLSAIGGTWGENTGYYGSLFLRDLVKRKVKDKHFTVSTVFKTLRNLFLEFGFSEYLDGFFIRPFAMYLFPQILSNLALGLIVGKFAADFIFYIPTIISYELRTKFLGD